MDKKCGIFSSGLRCEWANGRLVLSKFILGFGVQKVYAVGPF